MFEFLTHPDIQTILKKQAGDFEPGLAVTIGLIAHLVMGLHELREYVDRLESDIPNLLSNVMRSIETDRYVSDIVRLQATACLEHLLEKSLPGYPFPNLRSVTWSLTWRPSGGRRQRLEIRAGLLEFATYQGFTYYVQRQIELNHGIPHTNGRPLLFYALPQGIQCSPVSYPENKYNSRTQRLGACELLLQHGADPNEVYKGRTPWGVLLEDFIGTWHEYALGPLGQTKNHRRDLPYDYLYVARHMLHHGADPDYDGLACPRYVSTRMIEDLLHEDCCKSTFIGICSCAAARRLRPKLEEIIGLLKQKKLEKQLGPRVHLGLPGHPESKLFSIPYYLWVGPTALLVIAFFKAWEWYSERYGAANSESRALVATCDSVRKSRADRRRAANAKIAELDEFKQRYRLGQYF